MPTPSFERPPARSCGHKIFVALEQLLAQQQRLERELSALASDQRAIAASLGALGPEGPSAQPSEAGTQDLSLKASSCRGACRALASEPVRAASKARSCRGTCRAPASEPPGGSVGVARTSDSLPSIASCGEAASTFGKQPPASGFIGKLAEAEATIGKENILKPLEARAFLESNPDTLYLDVQDEGSTTVPGTYRASLGTLFFKASGDLPDFRDPVIADRPRDAPILVTCGLGGQAKLGAQLLVDYGFTNVKTVDGGCLAWKATMAGQASVLPVGWPATVQRRHGFAEDCEVPEFSVTVGNGLRRSRSTAIELDESSTALGERQRSKTSTTPSAKVHCFVLAPTSPARIALDLCSIAVLVFDLVTVPWALAWNVPVEGWLRVCSTSIALFWTIDMIANFRTGFFEHGELRMNPGLIARRYMRTWFVPDVLIVFVDYASLTLTFLADLRGDTGDGDSANKLEVRIMVILRFAKWSRLLRLLSMMRFLRFSEVIERIMDRSYYSSSFLLVFQVLRLLFVIIYVNHLSACVWWGIGQQAASTRWVDLTVDGADYTYAEAAPFFQYVTSLHWAMTQILAGSMQVNAMNTGERLFTVACLIFGVLFLSSLVSTLASKMTQLQMMQQDRTAKLTQLRDFLRRKSVGPEVALNIIKQVSQSLQEKKPECLPDLQAWTFFSKANRVELHRELCKPHLLTHPFFHLVAHADDKVIRRLCDNAVRISTHSNHDTLFAAGARASAAYMVISGSMKYSQDPETSMALAPIVRRLAKGAWVCEAALWTLWTHVGSLEAESACEVLVLDAQMVVEVAQRMPQVCHLACEYGRAFHCRVTSARPPLVEWPTDVEVPFSSYEEIVDSLNPDTRRFVGLLALEAAHGHAPWTLWANRLREDIREGRCTAVLTSQGELECAVSAVALELERFDGRILVQLGVWDGHSAAPACQLPGARLRHGELPRAAMQRFLATQLAPLAEDVRISRCEWKSEVRTEAHGVPARYARAKHFASLDPCFVDRQPKADRMMERTISHRRSSERISEDVLVIAGDADEPASSEEDCFKGENATLRLFAWMQRGQFDRLGQSDLRRILASLHVSEELAQEARDASAQCERLRWQLPTMSNQSVDFSQAGGRGTAESSDGGDFEASDELEIGEA